MGTIGIPSISAAYAAVPPEKLAIATTSLNIVQRVGGPVATTLFSLFLDPGGHRGANLDTGDFVGIFTLLVGLHVLSLGATFRLPINFAHREKGAEARGFEAAEALAD